MKAAWKSSQAETEADSPLRSILWIALALRPQNRFALGRELAIWVRFAVTAGLLICGIGFLPFRKGEQSLLETRETSAVHWLRPTDKVVVWATEGDEGSAVPVRDERSPPPTSYTIAELPKRQPVLPQRICAVISGSKTASWGESPILPGQWECISSGVILEEQPSPGGASDVTALPKGISLFAMARGKDAYAVDYVRIKFSANDNSGAHSAAEAANRLTALLARTAKLDLPSDLADRVAKLTPFKADFSGIKILFAPEKIEKWRYNLIFSLMPGEGVSLKPVPRPHSMMPESASGSAPNL